MQSHMRKKEVIKVVMAVVLLLTMLFESGGTASALTIYISDGVYHEEGYIFVGESHSVIASHAVAFETVDNGGVWDYGGTVPVIYGYIWDDSQSVTQDGKPNTFTMMGNLFFVFEGNDSEEEIFIQMSKNYIYSDGMGTRGRGVEKIHEIMDTNPNIEHWNIISFHGANAALEDTLAVGDFYVNSYRNWIEYEFPEADCYFMSIGTMKKYYRGIKHKDAINNALAAAFPDRFLDYTAFYAERCPDRMIDTVHWDDGTYVDLLSDVLLTIQQMQRTSAAIMPVVQNSRLKRCRRQQTVLPYMHSREMG
ncbi:MAG: hypothetical protein K2G51_11870 [Lachnospiraceae bacterium]|nr:hypothetical protein [Lachnospiraceae bacterium]